MLSQRDYWDTLSLEKGGSYAPEPPFSGLKDLVSQLLPAPLKPLEAREPTAAAAEASKWSLLRRASSYRVYRDGEEVFAVEAPGFKGGMAGVQRDMQAGRTASYEWKTFSETCIYIYIYIYISIQICVYAAVK